MRSLFAMHARIVDNDPQTIAEHLLFGVLVPFSLLYGLIVSLRRLLYRQHILKSYRAGVPVISVGNLTAGGTGKTPMTDFLLKKLALKGYRCAVVSRGYGGSFRGDVSRVNVEGGVMKMTPQECGDEPFLLARRNPDARVYVARKRSLGVRAAEADGAAVILLDDGFQHLPVARDLNLLLMNARSPFGNHWVLPAGILREPISAMSDSDLVILTRAPKTLKVELPYGAPVLCSRHRLDESLIAADGAELSFSELEEKRCLAFAGIARPETFFASLKEAGLKKLTELPFADHQQYTEDVLARIIKACDNHDVLITTEKDAVKLSAVDFPLPLLQVGVELLFGETDEETGEEAGVLDHMLDQLMEPTS